MLLESLLGLLAKIKCRMIFSNDNETKSSNLRNWYISWNSIVKQASLNKDIFRYIRSSKCCLPGTLSQEASWNLVFHKKSKPRRGEREYRKGEIQRRWKESPRELLRGQPGQTGIGAQRTPPTRTSLIRCYVMVCFRGTFILILKSKQKIHENLSNWI